MDDSTKRGKLSGSTEVQYLTSIIDAALEILVENDHLMLDEDSRTTTRTTTTTLDPSRRSKARTCHDRPGTFLQDFDRTVLVRRSACSASSSVVVDSASGAATDKSTLNPSLDLL